MLLWHKKKSFFFCFCFCSCFLYLCNNNDYNISLDSSFIVDVEAKKKIKKKKNKINEENKKENKNYDVMVLFIHVLFIVNFYGFSISFSLPQFGFLFEWLLVMHTNFIICVCVCVCVILMVSMLFFSIFFCWSCTWLKKLLRKGWKINAGAHDGLENQINGDLFASMFMSYFQEKKTWNRVEQSKAGQTRRIFTIFRLFCVCVCVYVCVLLAFFVFRPSLSYVFLHSILTFLRNFFVFILFIFLLFFVLFCFRLLFSFYCCCCNVFYSIVFHCDYFYLFYLLFLQGSKNFFYLRSIFFECPWTLFFIKKKK